MTIEAMGWVATAISCGSYFFREPATLRRAQAAASCVWIVYGLTLGAVPLIAANVFVAFAALWSSRRQSVKS